MILYIMSRMQRILWFYHGLLTLLQPEIDQTYMYLNTTKQLWNAVSDTYSNLGNSLQVYEFKTKVKHTTQGNISITSYYNMLKSLWQELDLVYDLKWSYAKDNTHYQKTVEKDHDMEFLARLNVDLDEVRVHVLGKEPLPSISKSILWS